MLTFFFFFLNCKTSHHHIYNEHIFKNKETKKLNSVFGDVTNIIL